MSAKDAPGEVNDKNRQGNGAISPNFDDSPNISSAVDEEQQAIAAEEAAKKQAETTLIDGIPIEGDDVKYKASEIKKKGKTEYFVNVEGAEKRKREAARRAREEAMMAEQEAREKRLAAERAAREEEESTKRYIAEEKQKDYQRRKQREEAKRQAIKKVKQDDSYLKRANRREERRDNRRAIRSFLFTGWHKTVTIIVIVITIGVASFFVARAVLDVIKQNEYNQEVKEEEKRNSEDSYNMLSDVLDQADEHYRNYHLDKGDAIYDDAIKQTDDQLVKAKITYRRSQALYNLDDDYRALAIKYAKKAVEYDSSEYVIVDWARYVCEEAGEKSQASSYKKMRDELVQDNSGGSNSNGNTQEKGQG